MALLSEKLKVTTRLVKWEGNYEVPPESEVLINATSIGLGDASARVPLAIESLESDMVVADVIFNPPETRLIRDAQPRLPNARRAGNARQSSGDRFSDLDRPGCQRRRHARSVGGILGPLRSFF